ncbi:unnamed protein product [Coffea canephora]|uniref:Glycosyltransferase n=1 Tax=Coffea canephora TaxID=49390 RepID=A0A068UIG5_COFCA|nr:unnamed protein product [Coffea canephora]
MATIDISPSKIHILAFPFPAKGHINPMLHLCKRLSAKDFRCIPDDSDEPVEEDLKGFLARLRAAASRGLEELVEKCRKTDPYPPRIVIYDSTMPWILNLAHRVGLHGASFFTQSCAVCALYYHMDQGTIQLPLDKSVTVKLPSMPALESNDLPDLQYFPDPDNVITRTLLDQFSNIDKVDFILFNTFEELEDESPNAVPIGNPLIPYLLLFFQRNVTNAEACLKWLDERETCSVVYVSFGSIAAPGEDQIEEVAEALLRSNCKFLWVVREEEESKLPKNFKSESSEQGLIINWCPQLEVLAHWAIACFVTHCGWNSTIEALSAGVPMIAAPQWVDQTTNAKFIADVWQTGLRVKLNDKGFVGREEFEYCIRDITGGEREKEIRRNAKKWKELAIQAVGEGGSSDRNLEDFATSLLCLP